MASFFEIGLSAHLGKENQLVKLGKLLDWQRFSAILQDVHKEDGPTGYDTLKMFKALLLGQWHSLSDPGLEQSLRVRLDFLEFSGFSLGGKLPDETTFCRFRNKLVKQNKFYALFNEVNQQLEELGLKVKSADVAIVDATIISANARPRKVLKPESDENYTTEYSADPDAAWLKKGTRVNAEKGFFSAENKAMLRKKCLKNGLMYKAFRNKPLTKRMSQFNKLISKTRWRIEQCFGTIKRRFSYQKASYFTTEKVDAQFKMKAMCLNLLKAINKVEFA